jgi:hypothetical protein
MRYMLLIYQQEGAHASRSSEERERFVADHWAVIDETRKLGILQGVSPLQPTSTATTIRTKEGRKVVLDGPFAETKEQLAGYYILECENLDEAIGWASKLPQGCNSREGCIEIRPLGTLPERSEAPGSEYASAHNG